MPPSDDAARNPLPRDAKVLTEPLDSFCICSPDHSVGLNGDCPAESHPGHYGHRCSPGWGDRCHYTPPCARHAVPCGDYRERGHRRGHALGVYYTVPSCKCGADRADHEDAAL